MQKLKTCTIGLIGICLILSLTTLGIYAHPSSQGSSSETGETIKNNYVFILSLRDQADGVNESIRYFFNNVASKGDSVSVLTPMKSYSIKSLAPDRAVRVKMGEQLIGILKKDILNGNRRYLELIGEMRKALDDASRVYSTDSNQGFGNYGVIYERYTADLLRIRKIHQLNCLKYIMNASKAKGNNQIYYFYELETYPYRYFRSAGADMLNKVLNEASIKRMGPLFKNKKKIDNIRVENAVVNAIFFHGKTTKKEKESCSGDLFKVYEKLTKMSGGKFFESKSPLKAYKQTVESVKSQ